MGNGESLYGSKSQISRSRIEIVMADIEEDNVTNNEYNIKGSKSHMISLRNSLSSMISVTSSTQTDPKLFTHWPKRKFMFKWLNKLKDYHSFLSRSQQFLSSNMFLNGKNEYVCKGSDVKLNSLSTQTVNQIPDGYPFSNQLILHSNDKVQHEYLKESDDENKGSGSDMTLFKNCSDKEDHIEEMNEYSLPIVLDIESEHHEFGPLTKKPKLQNKIFKIPKEHLISQLSNTFYKNEINKSHNVNKIYGGGSVDSLTSITLISKSEKKGLIYQSKTNLISNGILGYSKRKSKLNCQAQSHLQYNSGETNPRSYCQRRNSNKRNNNRRKRPRSQSNHKNNVNPKSMTTLAKFPRCTSSNDLLSTKSSVWSESGKIPILSYKFWIAAIGKNWEVFHNPRDRRIESIGRLAKCRIQLTHLITRHSDGLLKQQVRIYASNQSNLEKCCKLFDDKFPEFYATSGLLKILYIRRNSKFGMMWNNEKDYQIDLPVYKIRQPVKKKRNSMAKKRNVLELGFLRNHLNNLNN